MSPAQLRGLPLEQATPQAYGVLHGRQRGSLVADHGGRALSCTGHHIGPPIGRRVQGPDRLAVVTGCVPPGCRPRRRAGVARGGTPAPGVRRDRGGGAVYYTVTSGRLR